MAAKMQCPSCGEVLVEYGQDDEVRRAYRVYQSLPNYIEAPGIWTLVECLRCRYIAEIEQWGA